MQVELTSQEITILMASMEELPVKGDDGHRFMVRLKDKLRAMLEPINTPEPNAERERE